MDPRLRLVRAVERGSSIRAAARRFAVSPSAAIKLMQRVRTTGRAAPARFLRKAKRPESGVVRYWDTDIRGFVAHVQKNVTTLYFDRNNRRHLIGRFPTVTMPLTCPPESGSRG